MSQNFQCLHAQTRSPHVLTVAPSHNLRRCLALTASPHHHRALQLRGDIPLCLTFNPIVTIESFTIRSTCLICLISSPKSPNTALVRNPHCCQKRHTTDLPNCRACIQRKGNLQSGSLHYQLQTADSLLPSTDGFNLDQCIEQLRESKYLPLGQLKHVCEKVNQIKY